MPALTTAQVKSIIDRFIPAALTENPFVRALLAGGVAIGVLVGTPIFAPVGVVGAAGWIIVYIVAGGTFTMSAGAKAWEAWKTMGEEDRAEIDGHLERLKKAHEDGVLTEAEYQERARALLDKLMS